jgi:hypothetical protein
MIDPVRELKIRAEILQRRIASREPAALARLRRLPEFRACSDDELKAAGPHVLRRQCLTLLATELGFQGWPAARAALSGTGPVVDFGTVLYPDRCGGHLNLWYRRYDDAVTGRQVCAGYLLAYRRDFVVVQGSFIEVLGLEPTAPEWSQMGFDWVRPLDVRARTRLYGTLLSQLPSEAGA